MTGTAPLDPRVRATLEEFWAGAGLTAEQQKRWLFASRRYGPLVDFLKASPPGPESRVLDLGGGIGSLSVAMHATYGGHYDLADLIPPAPGREAHYAKFGIESFRPVRLDRPGSIDTLPRDYDLVLFVAIVEHLLVDPLVLFRGIYDRLRPGGKLLITSPNMARVGNRFKLLLGRSIKEAERFPQDGSEGYGHVVEFTLGELDYLLGWESFVRERARVIQYIPNANPSRLQRWGVPLLNSTLARRLPLGDNIHALYRTVPRPPPGSFRPARL